MLIAFFSDVHSNLPALEAAVKDARLRKADRLFCAGDITGYGPFPNEVCDFLQTNQIQAISGNYDAKVMTVINEGRSAVADLQKKKQKLLFWTADHINKHNRDYLSRLPDHLNLNFLDHKFLIVHGTPQDNDDDIYPSITARGLKAKMGDAQAEILVCGHTHIPFVKRVGKILVVNCGSAGKPVDGDPRLSYAMVSFSKNEAARGRIIRVSYDLNKATDALAETTLPKSLRKDLTLGTKRIFLQ